MHARSSTVIYCYISRKKLNAFNVVRYALFFPDCSYSEGLVKAGLTTLYDRRGTLCKELFSDIDTRGNYKLSHLRFCQCVLSKIII